MVDEDDQAERFQLNLNGVYELAGIFRLTEIAIGRTLARSCGEVGSAEDNYFFHWCCFFWLGDKIAENGDYTIFIFILLF